MCVYIPLGKEPSLPQKYATIHARWEWIIYWAIPGLFLAYFGVFNINTILQQINAMNDSCNINQKDLNSRPFRHESAPITIGPGLTLNIYFHASATCQRGSKRFIISVTRLGDLLDFGQVFKAYGNNQFAQISHILRQFL